MIQSTLYKKSAQTSNFSHILYRPFYVIDNNNNNLSQKVFPMTLPENIPQNNNDSELSFSLISNEALTNIKNPIALGIYCYVQSRQEGTIVSTEQIAEHFKFHKAVIDDYLYLLVKDGFLKRKEQ